MKKLISTIQIVSYIALVGIAFYLFFKVIESFQEHGLFLKLVISVLLWIVAYIVNTAVHEIGHFVGGIMDRYHFLLIQILWLRIIKYRGKIKIRLSRNPASQCVMIPAEKGKHWNMYQLMGLVFNILISLVAGFSGIEAGEGNWLFIICFAISVTGLCKIIANGIPFFKKGDPKNDFAFFFLLNIDKQFCAEYFLYLQCYERYINDYQIGTIERPSEKQSRFYSEMFWNEIMMMKSGL